MKRQPMKCKKVFSDHISGKGLIPKIYKEFLPFYSKMKQNNNPIKMAKGPEWTFPLKKIELANG